MAKLHFIKRMKRRGISQNGVVVVFRLGHTISLLKNRLRGFTMHVRRKFKLGGVVVVVYDYTLITTYKN